MQSAAIPFEEQNRLNDLKTYNVLDSPEEKEFNGLAELAAQVCNCSYALVTFIDKDRIWFKATKNILVKEIPRNFSFCAHTILQEGVLIVPDAKKDKRFDDNPYVYGPYQFSFYAGASIISANGYKIGTVCVIDKNAKENFTLDQSQALEIIAQQVACLLDLRLKNELLLKNNKSVLNAEQKVQLAINEQEDEKRFIVNELQENFAQTLAATKLYLEFAEQSKDLSSIFIQKSKEHILLIIKNIKALSKSMLPTTFQNANYIAFIEDMVNDFGNQHNIKIDFHLAGKSGGYEPGVGLTLFRVLQYQLKMAAYSGAKNASVKIKTRQDIEMVFTDDGKNLSASENEKKLLLQHIATRIGLVKGTVNVDSRKGRNIIGINIPMGNKYVEQVLF